MTDRNEKERRKKLFKELREKGNQEFEAGLPANRSTFDHLFNHLGIELSESDCDHTFKFTERFLQTWDVTNPGIVVQWLKDNGGYCDCEVLANVEQLFKR